MVTALYRTRFAPAPTGPLHLGHARTALVAWLRARSLGGQIVLRMEDLDPPRVRPGAAEAIVRDLCWLGIDWDEGPDVGGRRGPYQQSARLALYDEALARLVDQGLVYPCTCSRRELREIASAPHGGPCARYPGRCRSGPSHPGRPESLRFRMPEPAPRFTDALHGESSAPSEDFVVRRSDGLHAYQLAVVVDDAAMGITEVVRGDDLLSSTPAQIALYRALELPVPHFFHVPLVHGEDGVRLAKRHGAIGIGEYRASGVPPSRVVGLLGSSLGLVPPGADAMPADLVGAFSVSRLSPLPFRARLP